MPVAGLVPTSIIRWPIWILNFSPQSSQLILSELDQTNFLFFTFEGLLIHLLPQMPLNYQKLIAKYVVLKALFCMLSPYENQRISILGQHISFLKTLLCNQKHPQAHKS